MDEAKKGSDIAEEIKKELSSVAQNRYLTFYIEDEKYGINIHNVKEIIAYMRTTKIPKTPEYMKGVMNLRGNIIPVVDTRLKFNLKEIEPQMHTAIVIIQLGGVLVGFVVDMVDEVLSVKDEQLSDTPKFGSKIDTDYIKNMVRSEDEVIMVLNLDSLMSQQELEIYDTISQD